MSPISDSVRAAARKNNRCGSHEGERTGKANRSIRAQKMSVVNASEFDIVPAPVRKKVGRKRCLAVAWPAKAPQAPYSVSATPDLWL